MKRFSSWMPALAIVTGAAALIALNTGTSSSDVSQQARNAGNAAYRGGAYAGKLAAFRGEAPQIAGGRWAKQDDRNSFTAGYEQAYNENQTQPQRLSEVTNTAYRDGLYLGKLDASRGRDPHIASGRWSTGIDRASFSAGYRQAYEETLVAMR